MKMEMLKRLGISFVAAVLTFFLLFTNLLYTWDKILLDELCQTGTGADNRIFILAIDDKTLQRLVKRLEM